MRGINCQHSISRPMFRNSKFRQLSRRVRLHLDSYMWTLNKPTHLSSCSDGNPVSNHDTVNDCFPEPCHSDPGLDIGYVPAGPDAFFRWSGQFGPQQLIFYWPAGPVDFFFF